MVVEKGWGYVSCTSDSQVTKHLEKTDVEGMWRSSKNVQRENFPGEFPWRFPGRFTSDYLATATFLPVIRERRAASWVCTRASHNGVLKQDNTPPKLNGTEQVEGCTRA